MGFDADGTKPLEVPRLMNSKYGPGGTTVDVAGIFTFTVPPLLDRIFSETAR